MNPICFNEVGQKPADKRGEKGGVALWGVLIIMALMGAFLIAYPYLETLHEQNQVIRKMEVSSRWLLSHYHKKIYEDYGLLAYNHGKVMESSFKAFADHQFNSEDSKRLQGLEVKAIPLKRLSQPAQFMESIVLTLPEHLVEAAMTKASEPPRDVNVQGSGGPTTEVGWDTHRSDEEVDRQTKDLAEKVKKRVAETQSKTQNTTDEGAMVGSETVPEVPRLLMDRIRERQKAGVTLSLKDQVILNEFIMYNFSAYTTDAHQWNRAPVLQRNPKRLIQKGEVEFVLGGHANTQRNLQGVWLKMFGLRMVPNTAHLLQCPTHQEMIAVLAAASTAVFPIAEPIAYASIGGTWASLESYQDLKRLKAGKGVFTVKVNDSQWQTDFFADQTLNNQAGEGNEKGLDLRKSYYSDYLRVLLMATDGTLRICRIMALIEFQMSDEGSYLDLGDYVTEHRIQVLWRGKCYQFEEGYGIRDAVQAKGPGGRE